MDPTFFALSIVILLFSVIVHEVMHGLAALYFGDHTAERAGRLTLNPIPHIDPIGTVLLPMLLIFSQSPIVFGWAKPVPVNPFNFNDIRKGELFTSAAGIVANLVLAALAAITFYLTIGFASITALMALQYALYINVILATFNLLPVPPLDGSKILMSILPADLATQYQSIEKYGFLILIALIMFPVGGSSIWSLILGFVLRLTGNLTGIPFPISFF